MEKRHPNGREAATNPFGSLLDANESRLNAGGVKPAALPYEDDENDDDDDDSFGRQRKSS